MSAAGGNPLPTRPLGGTGLAVTALCVGGGPLGSMPQNFGYEVIGQLRHAADPRGFLITYLQAGAGVLEVFTYTADTEPSPWTPDDSRLGLRGIGSGGDDPAGTLGRLTALGGAPVPGAPATASGPLITDPDGVPLQAVTPR